MQFTNWFDDDMQKQRQEIWDALDKMAKESKKIKKISFLTKLYNKITG